MRVRGISHAGEEVAILIRGRNVAVNFRVANAFPEREERERVVLGWNDGG